MDRYVNDGALEHHKAADDTRRHLAWWSTCLSNYALVHLTPELIADERKRLSNTTTAKGRPLSNATVNRYVAALSSALSYACRQLRWIDDNPCLHLIRLKEAAGGERIFSYDEACRLFEACIVLYSSALPLACARERFSDCDGSRLTSSINSRISGKQRAVAHEAYSLMIFFPLKKKQRFAKCSFMVGSVTSKKTAISFCCQPNRFFGHTSLNTISASLLFEGEPRIRSRVS